MLTEQEQLELEIVSEVTHESRGERDGVGEREEWGRTAHLHRKYDIHAQKKAKADARAAVADE